MPRISRRIDPEIHVTNSTFITLNQLNYQNAGKLNIQILRKQILSSLRKCFALLLKAIIVFKILVSSR